MVTRGSTGRPPVPDRGHRLPPGQRETRGFPVLQIGRTPHIDVTRWRFVLYDRARPLKSWSWAQFDALPKTKWRGDIHCVTAWSKFDTLWEGVTVDDLLGDATGGAPPTPFALAVSFDDYSTNVPAADLVGGRAMIATRFAGAPIAPDHGGPARLLVPHLYFWKSAKWLRALRFTERDEPGFWEVNGYHMRGDPWREERFQDD